VVVVELKPVLNDLPNELGDVAHRHKQFGVIRYFPHD
jgi:hypothetical protein